MFRLLVSSSQSLLKVKQCKVIVATQQISKRLSLFSTTTTTSTSSAVQQSSSSSSSVSPPLVVISRRAMMEYNNKQKLLLKTKTGNSKKTTSSKTTTTTTSVDETPWPKKLVYTFYIGCSIFIPYSILWILSCNTYIREDMLGLIDDDDNNNDNTYKSRLLLWMRQHFGIIDYNSVTETDMIYNNEILYKFDDEPTYTVRKQQNIINKQQNNSNNIRVRVFHNDNDNNNDNYTYHDLKATLPANHDILKQELKINLPYIAIDFPKNDNDANTTTTTTTTLDNTTFDESSSINELQDDENDNLNQDNNEKNQQQQKQQKQQPIMNDVMNNNSVYSSWYYFQQPAAQQHNKEQNQKKIMSDTAIELSRIDYEIQQLQDQIVGGLRSIDDIQLEIKQLQIERRKIQFKQWIPFL